ncbi:MAG: SAM-dependent methyltransferase [Aureliella sp.]
MILRRNNSNSESALISNWNDHYARHVNPELMTRLLRTAVPVLEEMKWIVTEVAEGYAASVLPLAKESTNQHGTHQAALIALSADYTGGLALATLLTGVPLAGIHKCSDEDSASLWLADMSVRFRAPSTGHLKAECRVEPKLAEKITNRYFSGKRVFVTLPVAFSSNGEVVADAEMKYFAQPSKQLSGESDRGSDSPIYKAKLKASARMIAGVRAQAPRQRHIRIDCPHTALAATEHGHLLASRLSAALPHLPDMVHARTRHGDQTIRSIPGLAQVVIIGSGLDMRPYRLYSDASLITWFELDLPVMLEERHRVISLLQNPPPSRRRPIAMDLRSDRIDELLLRHPDFDPTKPTLVIYEGCSMYFDSESNRRVLKECRELLQHSQSRLWCDIVGLDVVEGNGQFPEVERFLAGMDELGEKFIFGHDEPAEFLREIGLDCAESTTCSEFLGECDAVYDLYRFNVARRA